MQTMRSAVLALLVSTVVQGADPVAPVPVTTNPADSPARFKTGKVFASTDVNRPPALGPLPAKVLVIVFSDFQCPVCRRTADATQQIAEEFPGEVRVEFWQHPLAMHSHAANAAVASLAAQRQGMFWEYHDEVFRNQSAIDPASLALHAEHVGLDPKRFQSDYADPELLARARSEAAFAERFEARSTPAFMVNGKVRIGWGSWSGFRADVERELIEARKLEGQGTPIEQIAERRAQAQIEDPELFRVYREQALHVAPEVSKPAKTATSKRKKK